MDTETLGHHFDLKASSYSEFYGTHRPRHLYEYEKRVRLETAVTWLEGFRANSALSLVDVGCGSGEFLSRILRSRDEAEVLGIDTSANMVDAACALLAEQQRAGRATLRVGELLETDRVFDAVVSLGVIGYQSDQGAFAANLASKVAAGGVLVISYANGDSILRRARATLSTLRKTNPIAFAPISARTLDNRLADEGLVRVAERYVCCDLGIPAGRFSVVVSRSVERYLLSAKLAKRVCGVGIAMYRREIEKQYTAGSARAA